MARPALIQRSLRRGLAPMVIVGLLAAAVAGMFMVKTLAGRLNGDFPGAADSYRPLSSLSDFDPAKAAADAAASVDPDPAPAPSTGTGTGAAPSNLAAAKAEAQAAYQAFVAASASGNPATIETARLRLAAAEKAYREAIGSP